MGNESALRAIDGGGQVAVEPDWSLTYSAADDRVAAAEHWRSIVREMREVGTLAEANGAQIERAVDLRIVYERARRHVAEHGAVNPPRRGNAKAIARVSPYWQVMREAASDLDRTEAELGLSPRRRGAATKVDRKARAKAAADEFLRPVAK